MLMFRKICWNPKLANTAESNSAQANTARTFAGINFFFAGLSLPSYTVESELNFLNLKLEYLLKILFLENQF